MPDENSITERRREDLADERHETEESLRIITQTVSDAIITINEDSTILFVNRAAEHIFGYAIDEMLGKHLTMLMPEYLRHLHRVGLKQYIETGQRHIAWEAVELPGLHKNGEEISLELSFGEFTRDGKHFFTGVARDVRRRKRDEQCLAVQGAVTRIMADATSLADTTPRILEVICLNLGWDGGQLWLVDPEKNELQQVTSWHLSSASISQFAEASSQAKCAAGIGVPGRIWTSKAPVWMNDLETDAKLPGAGITAQAHLGSVFGFPILLAKEILGVMVFFMRKTHPPEQELVETLTAVGGQIGQFIERKQIEEERVNLLAREQEARLQAQAVTWQVSALQKVTDAALAHLSMEELLAELLHRIRGVLHVDTVAILLLEAAGDELIPWAAQGLEEEVELGIRIPIGKGFAGRIVAEGKPVIINDVSQADLHNPLLREKGIASLLGVPLWIEGRAIGVLHVGTFQQFRFTDVDVDLLQLVADRIALAIENARLYQVERNARANAERANQAKDEFLTILSHELRTPLTPIIGWLSMISGGILPEQDFPQALLVVNRNAHKLKRLINDLLDMSAVVIGKMRVEKASVMLDAVLKEAVETMRPYAHDSDVHLALDIRDGKDSLVIIGDRARLVQAFCNLLHNAIKFSLSGGSVHILCETQGADAVVLVKDEGQGISSEFLPHVFGRFRQADGSRSRAHGGLGIGLALVKSFIEAHGGSVAAESQGEMKGSVFTTRLPCESRRWPTIKKSEHENIPQKLGKGARILLVDDQSDTLEVLAATFESCGFDTVSCRSAAEALHAVDLGTFDLLISDIAMPLIDGLELIRSLRQRPDLRNVPAIALTGYASENDAQAAIAAGFDLHLAKPVDPSELTTLVGDLLRSKSSGKT